MIAVLAVIADLCASPLPPAPAADPADSTAYTAAGDEARAAGDVRIAALAYQKAIAADPTNQAAQQALAALCRDDTGGRELADAIAKFRADDFDAAEPALLAIAGRGGADANAARLLLGIIALRRHDTDAAEQALELASRDPAYAETAAPLLRLARRDGVVSGQVVVEPEVDTNPQLLPDTPPAGATTGRPSTDVDLLLLGTVAARPWHWLAVRDTLAWRNQYAESELDFIGNTAQLAAEADHHADHVEIRYDLDYDMLAGASYLVANRGTAAYRHGFGTISFDASYALRRRAYQQSDQAAFTGWVHTADAGVVVHATPKLDIDLRAVGWRELTAEPSFANVAGGLQVGVRARPHPRVRLAGLISGWYAHYDAAEADGTLRRDVHGEASVDVELDLGDHVIALGGASIARNDSTFDDFRFWKLVARAGVAVAFGGP